jgi:hypothetical protein
LGDICEGTQADERYFIGSSPHLVRDDFHRRMLVMESGNFVPGVSQSVDAMEQTSIDGGSIIHGSRRAFARKTGGIQLVNHDLNVSAGQFCGNVSGDSCNRDHVYPRIE